MKKAYDSCSDWFKQALEYGFKVTHKVDEPVYQAWHLQFQPNRTAPDWLLHGEYTDGDGGWLSPLKLN